MKKLSSLLLYILLMSIVPVAIYGQDVLKEVCEVEDIPGLVFSAHWQPQAQFAGYYVAKEKGFYAEAGLNVEIEHPTHGSNVVTKFLKKEVDIMSLYLTSGIFYKSSGLKLVHLMQLSQNSSILIIAQPQYTSLEQLRGKRLAYWKAGFSELVYALESDLDLNLEWIACVSSVNIFISKAVDAAMGMTYNEHFQIIMRGSEITDKNVFPIADYYNIPEDALFCSEAFYESRKGDADKFVEATKRGWEWARENVEETLQIVMKVMRQNNISASYIQQKYMLEKILEVQVAKETGEADFILRKDQYELANEVLLRSMVIEEVIPWDKFRKREVVQ